MRRRIKGRGGDRYDCLVEVLVALLSFRTYSKNTLKSGNTIFCIARKINFFVISYLQKVS
jgi:hypothetical protein